MTIAALIPEEYDRSGILGNSSNLHASFKSSFDEIKEIVQKGAKINIGTASNISKHEIYTLFEWLRRSLFHHPAIIPQVWIRHIYDSSRNPISDPLNEEAYSRVDFIMLWDGLKAVIEIDGPEHYATWNKSSRTWNISDEVYTNNLRRERLLKDEGWLFFRFSNLEINSANNWREIQEINNIELEFMKRSDDQTSNEPSHYYFV